MTYDTTFPRYADRIIRCLIGLLVVGTVLCQWKWGWQVSLAYAAGTLFHTGFFYFMKWKYLHWQKMGREPLFMGRRLVVFTMSRFILEIILAVVVVVFTPLNILGFLAGLLTQAAATFVERAAVVIKE